MIRRCFQRYSVESKLENYVANCGQTTKSKKNQNGSKKAVKRSLVSPDNGGGQPEKKSTVSKMSSHGNNSNSQSDFQNSVSSNNYIQPLNMNSMNSYANYQTPVGAFYTPPQQQQQFINPSPIQNAGLSTMGSFQQLILERLDSLDKKLGKLDSIESKMSDITKKLSSMDSRLCSLEKSQQESNQTVQELENSRLFDGQSVDDLKSKQSELGQQLKKEKERIDSMSRECSKLKSVRDDRYFRSTVPFYAG